MRSLYVASALLCLAPAAQPCFAGEAKLTEDDRMEILRGLTAEFATVKTYLPRSKKPLEFESNGNWDKEKWQQTGREFGLAARARSKRTCKALTSPDSGTITS